MSRSLEELVLAKVLLPVEAALAPGQMPLRRLYVTKQFANWASTLSKTPARSQLLADAIELATVFSEFVGGSALIAAGVIVRVNPPAGMGIVKLKTPSLRLVGWCPEPQALVLDAGAHKKDIVAGLAPNDRCQAKTVISTRSNLRAKWITGELNELFPAQR